jgi:hypothetical protein
MSTLPLRANVLGGNSTRVRQIALDNFHLPSHNLSPPMRSTITLSGGDYQSLGVETLFTRQILFRRASTTSVSVQENDRHHRRMTFPTNPVPPRSWHRLVAEGLDPEISPVHGEVAFAWLVLAKHGIPSPRRECAHQKAFAALAG